MKKVWGSGDMIVSFLTSVVDGCEWSPSHSGCFAPGEKAPSAHSTGGWVSPSLDTADWNLIDRDPKVIYSRS
jgi:hypothetical protein